MSDANRLPQIDKLLNFAIKKGASDLKITAGQQPWMRLNGKWQAVDMPPLTSEVVSGLIRGLMNENQQTELQEGNDQDFSVSFEGTRLRMNIHNTSGGMGAVIRIQNPEMPELKNLGLPPKINDLIKMDKGLILVTGPTGSGKSTSLAAIIDELNKNHHHHIVTLEDPIEYAHHPKKSTITQREIGSNAKSYASALKSALRMAPDIILLGELRDRHTVEEALHAAETGHLVFATLHCGSAAQAPDRIVNMFPAEDKDHARESIANTLVGVLTQQLVPKANGEGRVAASELLVATPGVRNLIREGKTPQLRSQMQTGMKYGMVTMDRSLNELKENGIIDLQAHQTALANYKRGGGSVESESLGR